MISLLKRLSRHAKPAPATVRPASRAHRERRPVTPRMRRGPSVARPYVVTGQRGLPARPRPSGRRAPFRLRRRAGLTVRIIRWFHPGLIRFHSGAFVVAGGTRCVLARPRLTPVVRVGLEGDLIRRGRVPAAPLDGPPPTCADLLADLLSGER